MNTIGAFLTRQGSANVVHTYPVQFNTTGIASGIKVDTIRASAAKPVQIEVSAQVITAFNAVTTNVLTAGTDTTATQWLGAADITEGTPGFYPASNAVKKFRLTADTDVYLKYTQTGTAATTGSAVIIIKEFSEDTASIV
jgi:hypothetical protein